MTHKAKELETVTIFTIPNGYSGIETTYRIVSEQSIIPVRTGTGSTGGTENEGVENGGVDRLCGKCRNDKVWKAIRRKCSKVPDEIWLSWLSCLLVVKRNSQASQPVNAATEQQTVGTSKQCIATHGAVSHTVGSEKMLSESHSEFPTRTTMTTLRPHRIS